MTHPKNIYNVWSTKEELQAAWEQYKLDTPEQRFTDKLKQKRITELLAKSAGFYRTEAGVCISPVVVDAYIAAIDSKYVRRVIACNSKWALVEIETSIAVRFSQSLAGSGVLWQHFGKILISNYVNALHGRITTLIKNHVTRYVQHCSDVGEYGYDCQEYFGEHIPPHWYLTQPITAQRISGDDISTVIRYLTRTGDIKHVSKVKTPTLTDAVQYVFKCEGTIPTGLARLLTSMWSYQTVSCIAK